jgi:hypothetical protein
MRSKMTKEQEMEEFETRRELMEKIKIKDIENEISEIDIILSYKESLKCYEEDSEGEDEISDLNFEEKLLIDFNKDKNS